MLAFLLLITDEQKSELVEKLYWEYHEDMIRLARQRSGMSWMRSRVPRCIVDLPVM